MRRAIAAGLAVVLLWPLAAVAQETAAEPLPEPGTELEPGRYGNDVVGPTVEFRVDEGWLVGPSGGGPIFTLEYAESPGTVLSVTRFDGEVFLDSCDPGSMILVEPSVTRLAEIIAGNPYLNPGTPRATEIDGHEGLVLDVGVPAYTECDLPYVLIWAIPVGEGGEFVQLADQQSRFIILDVGGDVIVIAIESFPGVPFGGLLEAATELIETMRIEPGEYVPPTPEPSPGSSAEPAASPAASPSSGPSPSPAASPSPALPLDQGAST